MKKHLLVLLCAVSMSYVSMAQSVSIGPRVGVNFATQKLSGDDDEVDEFNDAVKSNTGLQAGLVLNLALNDMFSIQPELLYAQKGFKLEEGDTKLTFKANYLEVPVLAKIAFGSETMQGFVTAGPTIGYWMNGKSEGTFLGEDLGSEDYDFDDTDNRLDLGASVGVGIGYGVGPGILNLDVRYGFGLSSVYDGGDDDDTKVRNNVFGVSLAYLFGGR